jgi:hypothetical protein
MQIDFFVFDALPEPFHEDVIPPAPLAIHADLYAMGFQKTSKLEAGELAALIGVEDVRFAIPVDRLLDRFQAEVSGERIR